jgi:effector-binding domain-containing protein
MAELEIVDVPEAHVLAKRATCRHSELGPTIGRLYGELMSTYPNAKMMAPPCVYYLEWREEDCDIEAAVEVDASGMEGAADLKKVPACRAVRTTFVGHYDGLADAWMRLWSDIREQGFQPEALPPWDCYVTDPQEEADPGRWITDLYVPVRIQQLA